MAVGARLHPACPVNRILVTTSGDEMLRNHHFADNNIIINK
jgi:hypothetical protein